MAFHDWNHDGKKDMVDDYIEYQIYNKSMKDSENDSGNYSSSAGGDGYLTAIGIGLLIFGIFMIIGML